MTYAELRRLWEKDKLHPLEAKEKPRARVANLAGHADVAPLYGPEDVAAIDPVTDLGVPGSPPFTPQGGTNHRSSWIEMVPEARKR